MKSHSTILITLILVGCVGTQKIRDGKSTIVHENDSARKTRNSIFNNAFPSKNGIVGELYKVRARYAAVKLRDHVRVSVGTRLDIYDSKFISDRNLPKVCSVEVIDVKNTFVIVKVADKVDNGNFELKVRQLALIAKDLGSTKNDVGLGKIETLKNKYESNPMYIIGSIVNLRESYTTRSSVLKKLPRGTIVYLLQESNQVIPEWSRVKYREDEVWSHHKISEDDIDSEKKLNALYIEGWIYKSLLSTKKPIKTQQANLKRREPLGILGRWLEVVPNLPQYNHIILIRKTNSGYFIERHMQDGSSGSHALTEYFVGGERRFKEVGNNFGEYYVIDKSGGLRMYDHEGYIKTAQPKKQ